MADTDVERGTTTPTAHQGARRQAHPALILLVIAGAQMMVVLDGTIVNIALPSMGRYFDKSQTDMTWALNAYALAFGGLLLLGGRMGDILGRRRMFILGLSLFTIGSFLAGVAPSFGLLLAGRAVQGIGGAIASPTALSLITTEFEEGEARTRAIAVYAAVSGAGAALGLLLGGVLTNYLSWRWVLFVNVPIGILLMIGAFLYLHESERLRGKFDFIGAGLSVAGLVATVYGFIHVAHSGWNNAQTYAVFAAAIVLLVAFVYFEAKVAAEPMMPMRIFENRNRAGTYLIMLVVGAAMFGMFYFITFFVQGVREYGPLKTGVAFLPVAFVIGIVSQINAKLMPRLGPKPLMITGTSLLTRGPVLVRHGEQGLELRRQAAARHVRAGRRDGLPVRPADRDRGVQRREHRRRAGLGAAQRRAAGRRRARPVGDDDGVRHRGQELEHRPHQGPARRRCRTSRSCRPVVGFLQAHGQNAETEGHPGVRAGASRAPARSSPRAARSTTSSRELLAYASGKGFLLGAALRRRRDHLGGRADQRQEDRPARSDAPRRSPSPPTHAAPSCPCRRSHLGVRHTDNCRVSTR